MDSKPADREVNTTSHQAYKLDVYEKIADAIEAYAQSAKIGNSSGMKAVMHPAAQIYGYLDGELMAGEMKILYDYVDQNPGAGDVLKHAITFIDEMNGIACVRVSIRNWHGHNFTDYFTLLSIEGVWLITNKVFSH